ncbi:MAG TPA: TIGR04551 family protein [Kofleriaceae bacterium]|nr:TIGR04551 family protein [Kofleriaceae bacterium]
MARWVLAAGVLVAEAPIAQAQISPGGGLGPGAGGPSQPSGEEKKEGVAEAAPKTPGLLPTTPALPAPQGRRKHWKLLELDGYYRLRTDWMRNFNEGFPEPGFGGTPFPTALGCKSTTMGHPCDDSLSSANMRLRLEPTINLDEGTSVHVQADLLDNLILGSTPFDQSLAGAYPSTGASPVSPPVGAFGNGTQAAVSQGVNSDRSSVQIKRAWGEVALPLGVLKFGRMPNQWGMGILYNAGGADPINGTYDYDADGGDTVDRVSFSALIPGTNLRAMVASDWVVTRPASNQTAANKGHETHPFDLDDSDDMNAWVGVISRMDSPQEFKDTVDRGELAFNYGFYFEYKTQSWDYNLSDFTLGGPTDPGGTAGSPHYVPRGLKQYSPDAWAKVGFGKLTAEAEFAAQLGSIDHLDDAGHVGAADIRKFGGAARLTYRGLEGKFRIGIEGGFASGDHLSDPTHPGVINLAFADPLRGIVDDSKLTQFAFNPGYRVDQILWRHLIGAVSNAAYAKPFLQYDVTRSVTFKLANVTSFALRTASTPGHDSAYGTEFDGDLGYNSGGLFVGISYGVLFPFSALNHPADSTQGIFGFVDPMAPNDTSNVKDAETSHLIQTRIVLAF